MTGLPGWRFLCQLSQIWHILNWLAIKISCWHFRLKCQQVIFFLLPTTLQYAKFEKVGIKTPTWQPCACTVKAIYWACILQFLMFALWLHHFLILSTLWKEMGIAEKEGGFLDFDVILRKKFCQLLKLLPGSGVKSACKYLPQRG